ncbi:MAG TPA: response regulator [Kofleriaceae bacterium]|nr:response regulator [Kofleriaceae bacterium]
MKALIVDDERLARVELRRLLAAHPAIEIVGEAADAGAARAQIEALDPALIFLDIEMPGETAFDLLASLDAAPAVVFTTAFDHHAVRAFEVSALDYLLKPIEPARLATAIERVLAAQLGKPRAPEPAAGRVFVRDGDRCWFVTLADVPVIESEGNYARLDVPGQPLLARSLGYLEARLAASFFRANRQQLVNLGHVARIEPGPGGGLILILTSGREVEMSRRQAQKFRLLTSL